MTSLVFAPPAPPSLPVLGHEARFPLRRVYCIGRNYPWPGDGGAVPEEPFYFMKPADAVCLAEGSLPYPPLTADFCHEIEWVVAIGRHGFEIAPDEALSHVWAYGVGLDLTRRDLQQAAKAQGRPWEGSKAFDACATCTPLRPVSEVGHPRQGAIWLSVNGVMRQQADLADLLHPVELLISALSRAVPLHPGDLIYTGTPAGVGPLLPGDRVSGGIDGVGRFELLVASPKA